ncbi:hypothetical protein FRC12_023702 [Ceratobasidium sp. 428]|nr:hypothetical protein FRC12_023702 [Ceratobasidium sp. 428]
MPAAREHDDDESGCNTRKMMIHARQMTRLGQMFWNVAIVVKRAKTWGRKNEAERKAMEDSASDDEKHIFALVKLLAVLEPDVITELARTGRGSRTLAELVEHQLSKGQSNAKAEDMRKVRLLLCTWRTWATRPDAENPSTRGLHNPETAFLLTSLDLDWDDLDVRRKFMNGEILISELDFPRFCYPQGKGDKDKPWLNAFCGELLIRGARAIVLSPAASKNNPITATAGSSSGGRRRAAKSRGLTGLAKRYDMAEVAPPLIAYVTVVVSTSRSYLRRGLQR